MRSASADAATDFKLTKGSFEVPTDWKQDLQNQLLTSLASKGYNGFGIFPTDGDAANGIVSQLVSRGDPVVAVGGCGHEPTKKSFCLPPHVGAPAHTAAKAGISAEGGKGVLLHATGLLTDPNTHLRDQPAQKPVSQAR